MAHAGRLFFSVVSHTGCGDGLMQVPASSEGSVLSQAFLMAVDKFTLLF